MSRTREALVPLADYFFLATLAAMWAFCLEAPDGLVPMRWSLPGSESRGKVRSRHSAASQIEPVRALNSFALSVTVVVGLGCISRRRASS